MSAFFTRLCQSQLSVLYRPAEFYQAFLHDTALVVQSPKKMFSPIQNLFLKYFVILHEFVQVEQSQKSQLTDFIDGYVLTFPAEEATVMEIFEQVTGLEYNNDVPPEIWLLVKNHEHRLLVLDAFGAITFPVYTFDLNAAEVEDLLTIPGIQESDAEKIIAHRQANGFFANLKQIREIPGVSATSAERILNYAFDQAWFDALAEPELTITSLLTVPLQQIFLRGTLYFLFVFAAVYGMFLREAKLSFGKMAASFILHFLGLLFVIVAGLLSVAVSGAPFKIFAPVLAAVFIIFAIFYRKDRAKIRQLAATIALMGVLVALSV